MHSGGRRATRHRSASLTDGKLTVNVEVVAARPSAVARRVLSVMSDVLMAAGPVTAKPRTCFLSERRRRFATCLGVGRKGWIVPASARPNDSPVS